MSSPGSHMNLATALALVSGTGWGVNMIVVRWALDRTGARSDVGSLVSIGVAAVVATAAAIVTGADTAGLTADNIARFALVGAIAPGAAQTLFLGSIRTIGPARSGVLVGTAPMFSVVLAILFLGEGWKAEVVVGTLATVAGGVIIARVAETDASVRRVGAIGVGLAVVTALAFGVRDVVARHFTGGTRIAVPWAAAVVLTSGAAVLLVITLFRTRNLVVEVASALPQMLWSGLAVGIALPVLLEGLSRGEVGVVAPINNGAQVITVVVLAAVVFKRRDHRLRTVLAVVLVLAGGTLIGVTQ